MKKLTLLQKLSLVALLSVGSSVAYAAPPPIDVAQIGSISASQPQLVENATMLTTNAIAYIVPAGQLAGSDISDVAIGFVALGLLVLACLMRSLTGGKKTAADQLKKVLHPVHFMKCKLQLWYAKWLEGTAFQTSDQWIGDTA